VRSRTLALLALITLAGCSGAAGGGVASAPPVMTGAAPNGASLAADREIVRALNRLTYGARPGDLERVRAAGLSGWIERQLRPQTIDDSATEQLLAELTTLRMPIADLLREYPRPDPRLREMLASGTMTRAEIQERYPAEKRPGRFAMGRDHPIAWSHAVGQGRAFFTALGHARAAYATRSLRRHLGGAIAWAARAA